MNIYKSESGFTLVELITVLAIIGILSGLIMTDIMGIQKKIRDGQRKGDLRQIQAALEMYRADKGSYPISTTTVVNCPVADPEKFGDEEDCNRVYMDTIPKDPKGDDYTYSSDGKTYNLIACVENLNDPQRDSTNIAPCDGSITGSYTVKNP